MGAPYHSTKHLVIATSLVLLFHPPAGLTAQQANPAALPASDANSTAPTREQMAEVLRAVGDLRKELSDSRKEVGDLRKEVSDLRQQVAASGENSSGAGTLQSAVDELHDDQAMLQSQVKTLDQAKVSTESKYSLTLSGMILFNSFVVDGSVDNPILPSIALPRNNYYPHHSLGASIEQTQFGLSATGPRLWNARTSADLTADFFYAANYTTIPSPTSMSLQLRSADVNVAWEKTRISAGLQTPLVTPLSPTSFSTVSEPALAWSGNLWTWLPQITVERELAMRGSSRAVLGFGLIDPTTNDITGEAAYGIMRRSLQPGYEGRASYQWGDRQRPYEVSASGYYTRQLYYTNETSDSQPLDFWAGTVDWRVPVARPVELSGEFYRGRGIGDLGGGAFKNVITDTQGGYARGLNSTGGWAQLKGRLTRSLEVNAYFGEDSAQASEVREQIPIATASPYTYLIRNQSESANLIFRPRTYLIFSGEYRNLRSWYTYGYAGQAQSLDLTMGYLF